jgi:hypothetical protein
MLEIQNLRILYFRTVGLRWQRETAAGNQVPLCRNPSALARPEARVTGSGVARGPNTAQQRGIHQTVRRVIGLIFLELGESPCQQPMNTTVAAGNRRGKGKASATCGAEANRSATNMKNPRSPSDCLRHCSC